MYYNPTTGYGEDLHPHEHAGAGGDGAEEAPADDTIRQMILKVSAEYPGFEDARIAAVAARHLKRSGYNIDHIPTAVVRGVRHGL